MPDRLCYYEFNKIKRRFVLIDQFNIICVSMEVAECLSPVRGRPKPRVCLPPLGTSPAPGARFLRGLAMCEFAQLRAMERVAGSDFHTRLPRIPLPGGITFASAAHFVRRHDTCIEFCAFATTVND